MEIQIFLLLIVSSLASTVVRVSHKGNENNYDKMYTNNYNKMHAAIPKYEYNKFEKLLEFGVKQTHHDENIFQKIHLNKYVKFEKEDENNSLGSHISVIDDDYTNKILQRQNDNFLKLKKNIPKSLSEKQFKNQKESTKAVANSKSIEGTNNITNTSANYNSMVYNRLNSNISIHHIENIKSSKIRRSSEYRNKNISYQSLCPTKRKSVSLETIEYEYRPNHYIEVSCAHSYAPTYANIDDKNKICSEAGFSCMQLNRTMHLIRRNKSRSSECWESEIRVIPSGCECMWPKHYYGDILAYHESHKRYNVGVMNGYIPYISNNNS